VGKDGDSRDDDDVGCAGHEVGIADSGHVDDDQTVAPGSAGARADAETFTAKYKLQTLAEARFVVDVQAKLPALVATISDERGYRAEVDTLTDAAEVGSAPGPASAAGADRRRAA